MPKYSQDYITNQGGLSMSLGWGGVCRNVGAVAVEHGGVDLWWITCGDKNLQFHAVRIGFG